MRAHRSRPSVVASLALAAASLVGVGAASVGAEVATATPAHAEGLAPMPVYHPLNDGWDYYDELAGSHDRVCIGNLVQATKQDVFFFGTPAGDDRFSTEHLPVWADHLGRFRYGIPGRDRRGFKIADDTRGPVFDPTNDERVVDPETLKDIRDYIAFRFPALKRAPLIETRVCQYEQTPDSHFIIDRHPANENMWMVGGGSGHGFKHGPAVGEMMAELILKNREPEAMWRLGRFTNRSEP